MFFSLVGVTWPLLGFKNGILPSSWEMFAHRASKISLIICARFLWDGNSLSLIAGRQPVIKWRDGLNGPELTVSRRRVKNLEIRVSRKTKRKKVQALNELIKLIRDKGYRLGKRVAFEAKPFFWDKRPSIVYTHNYRFSTNYKQAHSGKRYQRA